MWSSFIKPYENSTDLMEEMLMTREIEIANLHNDIRVVKFTSGMTCVACYSFIISNLCSIMMV